MAEAWQCDADSGADMVPEGVAAMARDTGGIRLIPARFTRPIPHHL